MLASDLNKEGQLAESITIEESISRFSAKIVNCRQIWEATEKIFYELQRVPTRDSFELTLEIDGVTKTISRYDNTEFIILKNHFIENQDESEHNSLELKISKNQLDKKISIYSLQAFSRNLKSRSALQNINAIASKFEDHLSFIVFEMIEPFGSSTIRFLPLSQEPQEIIK
jgi:hypothetical protein